jgi:diguanylate cyclase (GGDEF)-like protein
MSGRNVSPFASPDSRGDPLLDTPRRIPPRALVLSIVTMSVPVAVAAFAPERLADDQGLLVWLTPILPAFLLSYYRGWRGAAVMLALGMVSLSAANLVFMLAGRPAPDWRAMLTLVVVYLVIIHGIAALAELLHRERRKAERMAFRDPLTGLANRRYADHHLERAFAAALRGGALAVVMFDLDDFKRVNDEHGHAVGDEVIRAMAATLARNTRGMDLAARFGGEEFLVVLTDIGPDAAVDFAERVRGELRDRVLSCGRVTTSAGVAAYASGMGSADVLVAAADRALYEAKAAGKDGVVLSEGVPARGPVTARASSSPPAEGSGCVVVVDDDVTILNPLTRVLRQLGYTVRPARGGREALMLFEGDGLTADILLTDVVMPDMNGLVLVDELTRRGYDLPVIYMSGQIQARVTWSGISGNVVAFLAKPVEMLALVDALRLASEARRTPAEVGRDARHSRVGRPEVLSAGHPEDPRLEVRTP